MNIGRAGKKAFTLPPDVATQATAIHGVRGRGKTVTAAVMVEEMLERDIPVVVIDPTDAWWGLKSSADGKKPGHDVVILGGHHGDLPLLSGSGRVIADFAVDQGPSMILSLRHLRKAEARRFVTDFAEQLFHRKGEIENRTPLCLVIDEASQFCPQRVQADSAKMVGAIQDIVRLGRSAGLGCVLIDQRPATVNKDILTQIELLICHAVTSPQDRKALDEWIRQRDTGDRREAFLEGLASLPRGEAWFWAPTDDLFERVQVRMRHTFDSSKTPEIGEAAVSPEARAEVDLDALRSALEATVAEAEANDPRVLRKRIAELEAEARSRPEQGSEPDPFEVVQERDRYVMAAVEKQREEFRELVAPVVEALDAFQAHVRDTLDELAGATDALRDGAEDADFDHELIDAGDDVVAAVARPVRPVAVSRKPAPSSGPSRSPDHLKGPHRKILDALARLDVVGIGRPDRSNVGAFSGYTASGGTFQKYVGEMRKAGLLEVHGDGTLSLTEFGADQVEDVAAPASLAELHAAWSAILPGPHTKLLEALTASYPVALSREELGDRTGYTASGGTFQKYVGRLRTLGLIDYPDRGTVTATELLFPEGLR